MTFRDKIKEHRSHPLKASHMEVIQVNLGYQCNMACKHCHIEAGPTRKELMGKEVINALLKVMEKTEIRTIDITGGAPELNPHFIYLVRKAREMEKHIIVRSNLTIFFEKGMEDLPEFYAENRVEVVASLPYYLEGNVDRVRGKGTFRKSIDALKILNDLGYGTNGSCHLKLVYNPQGAFLPPSQCSLEEEYKYALRDRFGISFNNLYTFANMPIGRFREFLVKSNNYDKYMNKLSAAFNPETLDGIMCKHLISVGWDGRLYDCDFNQVIGLTVLEGNPQYIHMFDYDILSERSIAVDDHCYGCTAGQGST